VPGASTVILDGYGLHLTEMKHFLLVRKLLTLTVFILYLPFIIIIIIIIIILVLYYILYYIILYCIIILVFLLGLGWCSG